MYDVRPRRWILVGVLGALVLVACGGGTKTPTASGSTTPTSRSSSPRGPSSVDTSTTDRPGSHATSTTVALLPAGHQGARADIPWSQVGPGWLLADVSSGIPPGLPDAGTTTTTTAPPTSSLFLVDPAGGRYLITTFPASEFNAPGRLVGWSGDGERALFTMSSGTFSSVVVTEVNLAAGATTSFTLAGDAGTTLGYTRPTGQGIVVESTRDRTTAAQRLDRTGAVQVTYPTFFPGVGAISSATFGSSPGFLYTADGTQLLMGTTGGLELLGNGGQPIRALPVPGVTDCSPLRWWTADTVLATCLLQAEASPRLWTVPVKGDAPSALTGTAVAGSGDAGDVDAWQLPGGVYVQDLGGCGFIYLAKLSHPGGTTTAVNVPHVPSGDSVKVFGSDGTRLAIGWSPPCGAGMTLAWYDPATNEVTNVLGPGTTGGSLLGALLYPA